MYSDNWIYTLRCDTGTKEEARDGKKGLRDRDVEGLETNM
jgi:hypothetical protein